jgi:hypothetical protein
MSIYKWTQHNIIEALNLHLATADRVTQCVISTGSKLNGTGSVPSNSVSISLLHHKLLQTQHHIYGELSTTYVTREPTILTGFSQFTSAAHLRA